MAEEKDQIAIAGLLDTTVVATAVLIPEGAHCKIRQVAVKADLSGQGIGSALMTFCEEYALQHGFKSVYCHARHTAINFYLKNNYVLKGDYFEEVTILHIKMQKTLCPQALLCDIEALEKKLLQPATRQSIEALDELLADDFKELGQSGLIYTKQAVLVTLPNEEPRKIIIKQFELTSLASNTCLVTYTSVEPQRSALRSSIWKVIDGRWKIIFHQGTTVTTPVR